MKKTVLYFSGLMCSLILSAVHATEVQTEQQTPQKTFNQIKEDITANKSRVEFKTTQGDFILELEDTAAPETVKNFLIYVNEGFYKNTLFHRVIPGFVIQGGGMKPDMSRKKTHNPVINESDNGLKNIRGSISMARTAHPDSATSQFFINVVNNASLDPMGKRPGYTVFGKVISGMDVIDKIVAVPTGNFGMYQDVPKQPVLTISAKQISATKTDAHP